MANKNYTLQGGIIQALSTWNKWNGYSMDYQGKKKLIFSLSDPKSCIAKGAPIRIHIEPKRHCKNWDFEISGSFADRNCTITDCTGTIVGQVYHPYFFIYLHNPLHAYNCTSELASYIYFI
jgi:hypothetical protein